MADIYYMSGNIKDNINGKLFIIRNDLEFSKIVKPSDNDLCFFKSDKESFFCHILNDKKTDQFYTNLQKSGIPSINTSSDNISTNNTPLPQLIKDILTRYNKVFINKHLDTFNENNAKDNLYVDLFSNIGKDTLPIPPKSLERLRINISTFRDKYKNSNYTDFIKELLESTDFNGNDIETLIPNFESFQKNKQISNIFDYLIIKFYYFIYDAATTKKINVNLNFGIDENLYEIRNKTTYNEKNYLNDFILYYIFEDVIKTDGMGYPNITPYINQYKQINGVFDIIRERLKNPTIFKFLRKYFIEHSSVKKYPYKNPYFSNIIFILNSKYNDGFNDDENAISFILSIIDFITISLFNPDHCNIHKRYYEHPIGTAMFYNILISNIDSLADDVYDKYFSSPEHNNISTSFTSDKLSLNNYNTPEDIFKNKNKNNYNYNNEKDKILLAYLISYFKHINENGIINLHNIIINHYLPSSTEYLDNFKLYILYINSIMTLDSRYYLKNIRGLCDITTCIKNDIKDIDDFVKKVTTEHKYIDYIDKLSSNIIDKEENKDFLKSYLSEIHNPDNPPDYFEKKSIEDLLNSLSKVNNTKINQKDIIDKLKNRRIVMVFILDHIYNKNLGFDKATSNRRYYRIGGGGTLNFISDVDKLEIILNKIEDRDVISTIYSHEIKNDKPLIEFYNLLIPNKIKNVRQFSANQTQSSTVSVPNDVVSSLTSNLDSEIYSEKKYEYVWNYSNDKLIRFNGYFNMIYDSSIEDIFGNKDKNINRNINIKFFKYFIEKNDYIKRVMDEHVNYNQDENNDVTVISINTLDNQIKHVIYVYSKENFAKFFANNSNLNNKIIAKIYNTPNGGDIYILFDILVDIFKDYISEHLEEQKNRDSFTSLNRYLKFVIDYYKLIDKLDYFTYYVELENWLYHIKSISDSGDHTEIIEAYKNELKTRIVICKAIISKSDNDNIDNINNIKKYLELLQYTNYNIDNIDIIADKVEYANRIKSSCEKQINRIRYYGKNFIFD